MNPGWSTRTAGASVEPRNRWWSRRRHEGAPLRSASSCSPGVASGPAQPKPHGRTRRRKACSPENLIPSPATPHARAAHAAPEVQTDAWREAYGRRKHQTHAAARGNWDWVGYQLGKLCSVGRLAVQHLQVFWDRSKSGQSSPSAFRPEPKA